MELIYLAVAHGVFLNQNLNDYVEVPISLVLYDVGGGGGGRGGCANY